MPREVVLAVFETRRFYTPGYSELLKGCFLAAEGQTEQAAEYLHQARKRARHEMPLPAGHRLDSDIRFGGSSVGVVSRSPT